MIVKFLKNSGNGSAEATMNYLLGKDNDREGARLLAGDPELTEKLSDSLSFQNRYTVGVLSFEEVDIPDEDKRAIMESFETSLLAGLEKDQYNITWIEHTDKNRLELNFVIANTELITGKRLQPYYDKVDRPLVENWKQVTNRDYGLTDPHDPQKIQAIKILNTQNLPEDIQKIKKQIGQVVSQQIEEGHITNRQGVVDTLESAGFEIARQTDKSISIKNPDGKRNIRLEGVIYENRQFGQEFAEEHHRARQDYEGGGAERYQTALNRLQRAVEFKHERNQANYGREYQDYRRGWSHLTADNRMESNARGIDGCSSSDTSHSVRPEHVARIASERKEGRIGRDYTENRAIAFGSSGIGESASNPEPRQKHLDNRQKPQEIGSRQQYQRQTEYKTGVSTDAQRLFDTLQRASTSTRDKDHTATSADRAIDSSQSSIERTKQQIISTDDSIGERKQTINEHQQQAEHLLKRTQEKTMIIDRGFDIEL